MPIKLRLPSNTKKAGQLRGIRSCADSGGGQRIWDGVTASHGISQSRAAKPTTANVVRHPYCEIMKGIIRPSRTIPERVPKSNKPQGNARSDSGKKRLTTRVPPGR